MERKKGLVSVVIPVYNVEKYISVCLDRVVEQTYQELEIIIVDDGSTDGSTEICEAYLQKDSRIRMIHKDQNAGLAAARNTGIEHATGEYLTFVDSDDWIDATFVETLLHQAQKDQAQLVFSSSYTFNEEKGEFYYYAHLFTKGLVALEDYLHHRCTGQQPMLYTAWGKLYHYRLFDGRSGIRFPDHRLHEDAVAVPRLFMRSNRISYVDESLYCYRTRKGSIMLGKTTLKQIKDNLYLTEQFVLDMLLMDYIPKKTVVVAYRSVCYSSKKQLEEAGLTATSVYQDLIARIDMINFFTFSNFPPFFGPTTK